MLKRKNIVWNLFGLGAPLIFAVATIPFLLDTMGEEKFGFFMLAWGLVGFSTLFDLGIGRATTHALSRRAGVSELSSVNTIFATAEKLAWPTGLLGTLLIALLVHFDAYAVLSYSPGLERSIELSFWIVAATIPLQVVSAMYRGVNEAYGQYRGISIVRIGLGVANFLLPALMVMWTKDLAALVSTLMISRLIAFIAFRVLAIRQIQTDNAAQDGRGHFDPQIARDLLSFGLWNTASSILNPVMAHSDRFIIGALVSVAAVSAYAVPFEVVTKLLIIPGAVTTVLFPAITTGLMDDETQALKSFWRWVSVTMVVMIAVSILFLFAIPWLLQLWLGESLPDGSIAVGRIIVIGLVPFTLGSLMVSLVHASSRPDITAKSHAVQTPLYLFLLYWAVANFGVEGAALAWCLRVTVDAIVLVVWSVRFRRPIGSAPPDVLGKDLGTP